MQCPRERQYNYVLLKCYNLYIDDSHKIHLLHITDKINRSRFDKDYILI